ncbi:hypothetical protein RHOSPDRAFT_29511 [Rhodotorula sp. JG-1b]|nr:hypothetical protein RHOSPDRAFT_29511 [Rhodotorula sp. JG-1b]
MSLYADAFSQARNPAAAFHAVQLRLSLERALTADLAELLSERAQLELAYVKSLQRLQQRLHSTHQKDSLSKEFEALQVDRKTADQQLGPAWTGLRISLENELAETATSHQLWADKLAKQVHDPLRNSLTKGDWARWNATEAQLASETKEYHQAVEKVQKAQAKQTKSSKASNQSKLLQAQSQLSSLGSHLAAALPAFLDQSQRLDLSHGAFLKEALVRCGTLTSDLGRERMEAGERLTVQVLGIDEAVEAEEWALRESIKLGSTGTGAGMPSIGEFGEPAAVASTGQVRSDSVADRSDAASTRSAATSRTNDRQRGGSSRLGQAAPPPPPPAAPLPLPTTDDARSTKEKRGLGSRLSTLIGGGGSGGSNKSSRDRASSIPNSARYADFSPSSSSSMATPPPPVPTLVTTPSSGAGATAAPSSSSFERRASDDASDLLGGNAMPPGGGGQAPLMPEQPQRQQSSSAASSASKRKSLMPGSGLFRRASKVNDYEPASGGYSGAGNNYLTAEPEEQGEEEQGSFGATPAAQAQGGQRRQEVDADGYSVPPQGYDRGIQETAAGRGGAGRQRSLLDDDDDEDEEQFGQNRASSVPKLSIVPDVPSKTGPSILPRVSEAERLAALENVKNALGSPNAGSSATMGGGIGGGAGVGAAGVARRATARGRRGTGSASPQPQSQSSVPVPVPGPARATGDSDDVPLATVVQQKHRREPPPPPPSLNHHRDAGAVAASSSLPASPAGSTFAPSPAAAPNRTMSILSATSSVGAMSSSASTTMHANRPDPFAGETSPGLRASIVETVNVLLKGGEVTRLLVTGEIGVSYRSTSGSVTEPGPSDLKVRLTGLDSLEKKAPNPALLLPGVGVGVDRDEFILSPTITAHAGATTTVFKYQLSLPATTTPAPVLVKPVWRCDPTQARAIVTYSVNGASPLFAPASSPFGEEDEPAAAASIDDLKLDLTLTSGTITSFQSKPATATLSPSGKSLTFSSLPTLSLASGEQKILASLVTDGQAAPGPVNVSWIVHGRTLGNVGIEVVDGGEVELAEVRRETVSGRYVAA